MPLFVCYGVYFIMYVIHGMIATVTINKNSSFLYDCVFV